MACRRAAPACPWSNTGSGARAWVDHRPPDRGCPYCDDPRIRRGGRVWINVFPHKPVTKKPAETRMGSGKGSPEYWVAVVSPGRVLFELSYPYEERARVAVSEAADQGAGHLPCMGRGDLTWPRHTIELNDLDTAGGSSKSCGRRSRRRSTCASATRPASSTTRRRSHGYSRQIARINTLIRQREDRGGRGREPK